MQRSFLILSSALLILSAGCVLAENSDKEFTCDLKGKITTTDLITSEKEITEDLSTWRVKVNISEEKLLFGRGDYLRGCEPLNDFFRLRINESLLLCQEEYEGKTRLEGGVKESETETEYLIRTSWDYPVSVTLDRYSLRFTREKGMRYLGKVKDGSVYGAMIEVKQSGICKEAKRKF